MVQKRLNINGPGLAKALEEANKYKKLCVFVYDYDSLGNILRVGYILKNKGELITPNTEPTWFSPKEIQISTENTPTREFNKGILDVKFVHPKKHERHFMISIELDSNSHILLRNIYRLEKSLVIGFVIQIEIKSTTKGKSTSKPIVRYDHAHGFIHRDMIASSGEKTKIELEIQDTREAIIFAIKELRENINNWLENLGYKTVDEHILDQTQLNSEIEKVKNKLLDLYDNPNKLDNMQSSLVAFTETEEKIKIWPPS